MCNQGADGSGRPVYIAADLRSPFLKAREKQRPIMEATK